MRPFRATLLGLPVLGLVAAGLVGLLAGAGGYTFYYAEGTSYLSNDPTACVNCHVMREHYDSWQKGGHHAVATCNDCHTPHDFLGKWYTKGENGFWHSYGFTLENYPEPIRIRPRNGRVLENNCIECHQELTDPITGVPPDPPGGWNCVHCHANVGHGSPR